MRASAKGSVSPLSHTSSAIRAPSKLGVCQIGSHYRRIDADREWQSIRRGERRQDAPAYHVSVRKQVPNDLVGLRRAAARDQVIAGAGGEAIGADGDVMEIVGRQCVNRLLHLRRPVE